MHSRLAWACGIALLALVTPAAPIDAQEVAASLRGRVRDTQGQGIGDVAVTAQSADLIRPLTTATAPTGDYVLVDLPPGPYVIAFSRAGLVPVKRTMRLSAGESAAVHIEMRPQDDFDGSITVTHEALAFPPSQAASVDARVTLQQLPVTGTRRSVIGLHTEASGLRPAESLFLFDGLPLRHGWSADDGDAFVGPGPEAIRELTMDPTRLPAGYGRLQAGTLALVTSAGARRLSASARVDLSAAGLTADLVRLSRPSDGVSPTVEYTAGGPSGGDRTWFFVSGRHLHESMTDDTALTDVPFRTRRTERFGTGRLTHALTDAQRIEAHWVGAHHRLADVPPAGALRVADVRALETRELTDRAFSAAYVGRLWRGVHLTARYTRETGTGRVAALAADADSIVERTRVVDQQTGVTAWASSGCIACDPRRATHDTMRITASALLPGRLVSHHLTLGVDVARDTVLPGSHPSGSRFQLHAARVETAGGEAFPVFAPGGSSWIVWAADADDRVRLRNDAFFVSDRWSLADAVTIDLGLRVDRHRGWTAADGRLIVAERGFSPRLGATWRLRPDLPWTVTAAYGRYVDGPLDRGLDALAPLPSRRVFVYEGPPINTTGPGVTTAEAVGLVHDWFAAAGGTTRASSFASQPGFSTIAKETISPPRADEWSFGVSRLLGEDGYARADITWRDYGGFSTRHVSVADPPTVDRFGLPVDAGHLAIDDRLWRRYAALSLTADYRFGHWADVGARYTLSSLRGTADNAALGSDPSDGVVLAYPEFMQPSWHLPVGALPDDARHRSRAWLQSELVANEAHGTLMLSFLLTGESGRPYGAAGLVNVGPFMPNPGYQQAPAVARYYFTARDARRTPAIMRADVGVSYTRRLPGTVHGELFARAAVLNLLGVVRVLHPERLTIVRTALTDPSLQPFDPFTETPVAGVHWTFDDDNVRESTARESLARTIGRALAVSFGVRF